MKFAACPLTIALFLLLSAVSAYADGEKAKEEEKVTDSPWTEDQLKDFFKSSLKVTYTHKEPIIVKTIINEPVMHLKDVDDKQVTFSTTEFDVDMSGRAAVSKPVDLDVTWTLKDALKGLFNQPVAFGQKLTVTEEKLKVAKETYACTVYTLVDDLGNNSARWWVCADLPGLVLKYHELGVVKINGAVVKDHISEYYEATKIEIPKDSVTPSERKKLDEKAARKKK